MWKEKVEGTKLAGFSGIKNSSPEFMQADEKLVCYWSSGIDSITEHCRMGSENKKKPGLTYCPTMSERVVAQEAH
ncbi:hypothetical protein TNIN_447081 [Trichonephila inaurata madagascariensis]|uniref:Uncharacterized protein n=1 Tax=Trichonephila inaurata madagascariensis TaxID=2747483 RepID=A0A8X6YMD5_9ARAC|nr:hypothetical protein TNIN_447081 [Trichonephila inaurata madagascariensis]